MSTTRLHHLHIMLSLVALLGVISHTFAASAQGGRVRRGPVVGVAAPRSPGNDYAVPRDRDRWHPSRAYFLVAPFNTGSTYLIDDELRVVNEWRSDYGPGLSAYLLDDGRLLRTATIGETSFNRAGGNGGRIELFTWHGALQWSLEYSTDRVQQHHDAILMPNRHVLLLAWETRTVAEALDAGRRPDTLPSGPEIWSDTVVEIDPHTGEIVWIWRVWDHLLPRGERPADHPGLIDPNFAAVPNADWTHANSVAYNADLDQVLVSARNHSEIWIIDHGTTTEEAAAHSGGRRGRGGDLLYRWGNPVAYGATGPRQLFGQHNAQWIPAGLSGAGHILLFNNGDSGGRPWSTVVEISPPLQDDGLYTLESSAGYGPAEPVWEYVADPPESLFGSYASGVQRLVNGGTLIAVTPTGRIREVDDTGQLLRDYQLSMNDEPLRMFRVTSFPPNAPAFAIHPLVSTGTTIGQVLYQR